MYILSHVISKTLFFRMCIKRDISNDCEVRIERNPNIPAYFMSIGIVVIKYFLCVHPVIEIRFSFRLCSLKHNHLMLVMLGVVKHNQLCF